MSDKQNAIVIGGGVIGLNSAYYLARLGWKVRLLESRRVGKACSHGNCGYICPSHALPLTMPGAPWKIMRKMFSRDSPLYIRPRFDPALWSWLLRFALRCRSQNVMRTARARNALVTSSMQLYRELIAEELLDVEWQDRGLLLVFSSADEFAEHQRMAALLNKEFGIVATSMDERRLLEFEPALRPGLAGGWHYKGDSHLRPDKLMTALGNTLRSYDVEIMEGVTVEQFEIENGSARHIETSAGRMTSELFVLTTGAESPAFARQLGCRIPVQPGKGYSITMARPRGAPLSP